MWLRISARAILLVTLVMAPGFVPASGQSSGQSSAQSQPAQDSANPSQAKTPVRVPTSVMLGRFDRKVMPVYPEEAMSKGIQGDVWFNIEVDESGKIVNAQATEGDPLLIAASKDALDKSSFHPYVVDGTPVRVQSELGFHFAVEKNGASVNGTVNCMAHKRE